MNLLQRVGQLVFGSETTVSLNDIHSIPSGQLFKLQKGDKRVLLFKECAVVLRRASIPFQYQLIVEPIIEQGDQVDIDDLAVLIDTDMEYNRKNETTFSFKDESTSYEFVSLDGPIEEKFETLLFQCIYERQHKKPFTEATVSELNALRKSLTPPKIEKKADTVRKTDSNTSVLYTAKGELYMFELSQATFILQYELVIVELIKVKDECIYVSS